MFKNMWLTVAMLVCALAVWSQSAQVKATPVAPLQVLQLEKLFQTDPLVHKTHGWHCRARVGPFGWHRHRRACGGYYDDPYDDPYYDDGRYYDGGPSIVIRPRHRARRCTHKVRRHCIRRWRHSSKRRARCLRKYRC